jgi:hypothetical protein
MLHDPFSATLALSTVVCMGVVVRLSGQSLEQREASGFSPKIHRAMGLVNLLMMLLLPVSQARLWGVILENALSMTAKDIVIFTIASVAPRRIICRRQGAAGEPSARPGPP